LLASLAFTLAGLVCGAVVSTGAMRQSVTYYACVVAPALVATGLLRAGYTRCFGGASGDGTGREERASF
jgi:cobalamin synthase